MRLTHMVPTPANLIGRVRTPLGGDRAEPPGCPTPTAYFRVAAIDSAGDESGPSDYAAAPRPPAVNRPEPVARIGKLCIVISRW